jgi:hypothetical protein
LYIPRLQSKSKEEDSRKFPVKTVSTLSRMFSKHKLLLPNVDNKTLCGPKNHKEDDVIVFRNEKYHACFDTKHKMSNRTQHPMLQL